MYWHYVEIVMPLQLTETEAEVVKATSVLTGKHQFK
jgi:hypothetical protein